jgi:hypothetical protein
MCFNAPSSLIAWVVANSIAFYLWNRNRNYDRWNAAFIFTFTLIQLLEAGLWTTDKEHMNQLLTSLIVLALLAQPLVQNYMGYKYTKQPVLWVFTIIYILLFIWGITKALSIENYKSYPGPNGHLVWERKDESHVLNPFTLLYLIGLFIPLLFMKNYLGIPLVAIGLITFAYSWMRTGGKEFSSLWCFTAVAYAFIALFL